MRALAVLSLVAVGACALGACGGAEKPQPTSATSEMPPPAEPPKEPEATSAGDKDAPKDEKEATVDTATGERVPAVEPQFTEGMSVEQAIKAVPQGAERANIDAETLGKPLQDFAVYEPCKPGSAHFKLRIAVWEGRVVGSDVTATPKNDKLVNCIKERLKTLTWQAKVKSLNTVDYAF